MGFLNDAITQLTTIRGAIRRKRTIPITMGANLLKADDGAPLAVFADGASDVPGLQITNSETFTVRWNNHAAPLGVACNVPMPQDLDHAYPIDFVAICSKTGATAGDITSLTLAAYVVAPAALHDADTDFGGATNVVTPAATAKTAQVLRRRLQPGDLAAPPWSLALSFKPTAGTLGTDDFLLHAAWLEYTSKYA